MRAEGRRLSGVALRYGDTAQSHRERFEAGSLRLDDHDFPRLGTQRDGPRPGVGARWRTRAGRTDPTRCAWTATLPPLPAGDRALEEVRAGKVTGLSIRFRPVRERMENGIRIIEEALLRGIAITRAPSYHRQPRRSPVRRKRQNMALTLSPWPPDTSVAALTAARTCLRDRAWSCRRRSSPMTQLDRLGGAAAAEVEVFAASAPQPY